MTNIQEDGPKMDKLPGFEGLDAESGLLTPDRRFLNRQTGPWEEPEPAAFDAEGNRLPGLKAESADLMTDKTGLGSVPCSY